MAHMKNPRPLSGGAGALEVFLAEPSEDNESPIGFQRLDGVATGLLMKLAERHHLTADRARVVASAAGLKGAAE